MDTRAMSKVKMGYEAIDASSSHQNTALSGRQRRGRPQKRTGKTNATDALTRRTAMQTREVARVKSVFARKIEVFLFSLENPAFCQLHVHGIPGYGHRVPREENMCYRGTPKTHFSDVVRPHEPGTT